MNPKDTKLLKKINRYQKKTTSIRIYDEDKEKIIKKYGSVQRFIDYMIEKELYK